MEDCMLTTLDNPYNPFTQFNEWFSFDAQKGYHTCSYLERIAKTSDDLSDTDNEEAIDEAMNEIVRFNLTGNYIKVTRESFERRKVL